MGRAALYRGSAAAGLEASPAWQAVGDQKDGLFALCVAGVGDVNGDGAADIAIGSYYYDVNTPNDGLVSVFYGRTAANDAPAFVTQPEDVHVTSGTAARFRVVATGAQPMSFSWQRNREPVVPSTRLRVESTGTVSMLTISDAGLTDAGLFRCLAMNPSGTALSREALLSVGGPLVIAAQPRDVTVPMGVSTEFRVGASGTPPMTYTWYHDGNAIAVNPSNAADTSTLYVPFVAWEDSGLYWCEVYGGYPPITRTSAPARLRILPAGVKPWWELMR